MRVEIYESIEQLDEAQWDAVAGSCGLICRHRYLRAVERAGINDSRYFYPVLYDGNRMKAHACAYYISTELDTFAQGIGKRLVDWIRRVWPSFLLLRSLECGTPVALGSTISFADVRPADEALRLLVESLQRLAREQRVPVLLFRDFYDAQLPQCALLHEMGYHRIPNLPGAHLAVRWRTFGAYLDSMRSHYKQKIVKRMRRFAASGLSVDVEHGFARHAARLAALWRNVYDRATEYRREILTARFFEEIDRELGDKSSIVLARYGRTIVGFTLLLDDEDKLVPLYSGLDYSYNERSALYFNLLYRAVEVGIVLGKRVVDLGITTLVPKKDLGAESIPIHMYIKGLNPLVDTVVPALWRLMTPGDGTGPRRVFKSSGRSPQ